MFTTEEWTGKWGNEGRGGRPKKWTRKWRGKLQKQTGEWGTSLKVCGGIFKSCPNSIIFKNWQTQKGVLEWKLHKSILGHCVFINFMLKIPLIMNYAEQFKKPPFNTPPASYAPALLIDFTGFQKNFTKYEIQLFFLIVRVIPYRRCCQKHKFNDNWIARMIIRSQIL